MTPAEHRAKAEELMTQAWTADDIARAQVHATLALTPTPPPPVQPQHRWDLSKPQAFPDATGGALAVTPAANKGGLVFNYDEDAWLFDNPQTMRDLASLLTAHADRLESKP